MTISYSELSSFDKVFLTPITTGTSGGMNVALSSNVQTGGKKTKKNKKNKNTKKNKKCSKKTKTQKWFGIF